MTYFPPRFAVLNRRGLQGPSIATVRSSGIEKPVGGLASPNVHFCRYGNATSSEILNISPFSPEYKPPCTRASSCLKNRQRRERALFKASLRREVLICDAETELARQTSGSYRIWFSCWRQRGVGVDDLLNMTWSWLHGGGFNL